MKFDDNACVLINQSGDPIGSRLSGEFPRPTFALSKFQRACFISNQILIHHALCRCCRTRIEEQEVVQNSLFSSHAFVILGIDHLSVALEKVDGKVELV